MTLFGHKLSARFLLGLALLTGNLLLIEIYRDASERIVPMLTLYASLAVGAWLGPGLAREDQQRIDEEADKTWEERSRGAGGGYRDTIGFLLVILVGLAFAVFALLTAFEL